ncbi:unnamed protein product [Mytilus coruscus]|uniref:DUF4371 domain-containing protein n=1 Tax=Mytilus coruscus TaxID=42192 RepID=A0A6J8AAU6_MYTCO|nr:unnamed protein product [Mytilus coruscus]
MSGQVVRSLATEIRQSNFFAILADKTTDISNRQQLVVCLRWMDDYLQAHEDLINLYKIDNTCCNYSRIDQRFVKVLLRNANNLSKTLQCKDLSAAESKSIAQKTVQTMKSLREDQCFDLFWENVVMKSRRKSVEEPVLPRKIRMPSRFEIGTATAEFHSTSKVFYRQTYFQAVDHIVQAITDRFEQEDFNIYLNTEQVLLKCVKDVDFSEEFKLVCQFYQEDLHEANL